MKKYLKIPLLLLIVIFWSNDLFSQYNTSFTFDFDERSRCDQVGPNQQIIIRLYYNDVEYDTLYQQSTSGANNEALFDDSGEINITSTRRPVSVGVYAFIHTRCAALWNHRAYINEDMSGEDDIGAPHKVAIQQCQSNNYEYDVGTRKAGLKLEYSISVSSYISITDDNTSIGDQHIHVEATEGYPSTEYDWKYKTDGEVWIDIPTPDPNPNPHILDIDYADLLNGDTYTGRISIRLYGYCLDYQESTGIIMTFYPSVTAKVKCLKDGTKITIDLGRSLLPGETLEYKISPINDPNNITTSGTIETLINDNEFIFYLSIPVYEYSIKLESIINGTVQATKTSHFSISNPDPIEIYLNEGIYEDDGITSTSIQINWDSDESFWIIQYSTNSDFSNPTTTLSINTQPPYIVSGLEPSTKYYFRVANAECPDDWSNVLTATTNSCDEPQNIETTITDTTAYITWDNINPSIPEFGWEITYTLGTYDNADDPTVSLIGDPIITYQPEVYIENLIPANDYTFFITASCSKGDYSDTVAIPIFTNCSNCTSFKPKPGKEYVISAWVKEDWSNRPDVSIDVGETEKGYIKTMLNDLVLKYNAFQDGSSDVVCPNGTIVNGLSEMTSANLFHQELLETQPTPAIYNFRYEDDGVSGSKFMFQFTDPGEMVWSDNLVVNPGAELPMNNNWRNVYGDIDTGIFRINTTYCDNGVSPHAGDYMFSVGKCHGNTKTGEAYQDVSVSNFLVQNKDARVELKAYIRAKASGNDEPIIWLDYINSDGINFESTESLKETNGSWLSINETYRIPARTEIIRIHLKGHYQSGSGNDSYFDDISLKIGSYENSDKIQTFDVDCIQGDGNNNPQQVFTLIDPQHYPYSNFYYKLNYNCNSNTIESKYKYGENVFKFNNINVNVNKQVYTYSHTYILLSYLNDMNEVVGSDLNRKFKPSGNIIDGWQRIQGVFKVPHGTVKVKIELVNGLDGPDNDGDPIDPDIPNDYQSDAYFDDVRIHPKDGNMKSFVYDQKTQKLMAELDENNFATFYEYDKEGGLIRVKKETEKGVFTIQETRSGNYKR